MKKTALLLITNLTLLLATADLTIDLDYERRGELSVNHFIGKYIAQWSYIDYKFVLGL